MISAGRLEDFPVGKFKVVVIRDQEVGILRSADGEVYAVRNYCPHRGAPICRGQVSGTMLASATGDLIYGLEGTVLRCPWHSWEFDVRTGDPLFGVSKGRLKVYRTSVEDGELHIQMKSRD